MNTNYRKKTQQLILSNLAAAAIALSFTTHALAAEPKPDAELQRLEEALNKAWPQSDMNIASGKISEYWDKKLAEVEKKVALKLDAEEKVQFEASKKRFISYREKEVEFRTSFYGRSKIRPLIESGVHSNLTKNRVREMEILIEDWPAPETLIEAL